MPEHRIRMTRYAYRGEWQYGQCDLCHGTMMRTVGGMYLDPIRYIHADANQKECPGVFVPDTPTAYDEAYR